MQYIIHIEDREYLNWTVEHDTQAGEARPGPLGLPETFHPLSHKLMDGDYFHFTEDGTFHLLKSPLRELASSITIPAILVLADGKTYGRTTNKKRLLYKCIPHNRALPVFLVPYDLRMELSKYIPNKYVCIKYIHWQDKHPLGELTETFGPVNSYDAFEKYQIQCKSVHVPITQYSQHIKTKFAETDEKSLIHSITQQYTPEDRTSEYIFSIDNDTTTDYDDAMSITENPEDGSMRISIYISNVLVWLQALDGWSTYSERVSTVYLPTRKIPMLPPHLSENLCSLIEKHTRFAIAMDYVISSDGSNTVSFSNTKIIVKKNYRYEKENLLLNIRYQKLFHITNTMDPSVKDSHEVVAYWMIKMNQSVGDVLYKHKVGIFRLATSQPSDPMENAVNATGSQTLDIETERMLYNFYNHICSEYRIFQDGEKYVHSAMLLENYVHFTSPIRRLVDLLNQIYLWGLMGNIVTTDMVQFMERWTSSPKLCYINNMMRAIRRTQTTCELVHICYNIQDLYKPDGYKTYSGVIFEKQQQSAEYEYAVYINELKYLARIHCEEDFSLRSEVQCRLFVFHDKSSVMDKIILQITTKLKST